MVGVFGAVVRRHTVYIREIWRIFYVFPVAAVLLSSCDTAEVKQVEYVERPVVYNEGEGNWDAITTSIFNRIASINTFAFVIPLFDEWEDMHRADGDIDQELLNSQYLLLYTPGEAPVNNVWYIVAMNGAEETASVIGRGGEIEYLIGDMYDAPGFDENDTRQCVGWTPLFPQQRRVQSCRETDCGLTLYLNGTNGSPDFTAIQGKKGWHLLVREGEGRSSQDCVFDTGKASGLLELGKR